MSKAFPEQLNIELWSNTTFLSEEKLKPAPLNTITNTCLRYVAEELLCTKPISEYEDEVLDRAQVDDGNTINNNELILGNFEGYDLGMGLVLRSLFISEDNHIVAEVWNDNDEYRHYIVA